MTVFAAPTVNGYKRFRPYSFAPDRVCWAVENRGALVRVQGSPGDTQQPRGDAARRAGREPLLLHGVEHRGGPGRHPARGSSRRRRFRADPYAVEAPALPTSLAQAVDALDADRFYREAFGDTLVDYLVMMKRAEIGRYEDALTQAPLPDGQDVSDWEMREYFEFF